MHGRHYTYNTSTSDFSCCLIIIIDISLPYSRRSFFGIINLFGPYIFNLVADRHQKRDARLTAEAKKVVVAHIAEMGPDVDEDYVRMKVQLELQTVFYEEYRCVRMPVAAYHLELTLPIIGAPILL